MKLTVDLPTGQCDKLIEVNEKSQAIGEFLEWLQGQGVVLARHHEHDEDCPRRCAREALDWWSYGSIEQLLAKYFEIDLNEVERERRRILKTLRAAQS